MTLPSALRLKKNSVVHAMVPSSYVEHRGGYTTKNYDASGTVMYADDKAKFKRKWRKPFIISLWERVLRYVRSRLP